ncbi:hypothetical protein, partial [Escherichia coli]|uniref:hypothetical protein n=1 Tax=Escherichia coli TaxID=562 RepID=UPI001BC88F5E
MLSGIHRCNSYNVIIPVSYTHLTLPTNWSRRVGLGGGGSRKKKKTKREKKKKIRRSKTKKKKKKKKKKVI